MSCCRDSFENVFYSPRLVRNALYSREHVLKLHLKASIHRDPAESYPSGPISTPPGLEFLEYGMLIGSFLVGALPIITVYED